MGAEGYIPIGCVTRRALLLTMLGVVACPTAWGGTIAALRAVNAMPLSDTAAYLERFGAFKASALSDATATTFARVETACLKQTGEVRLAEGVSYLKPDADLTWIARYYAAQLAQGAPFDHRDGGGRLGADRIGLLYRRMVGVNAENLYANSAFDPDRPEAAGRLALDNLMQSPGHRANILDPRWTHAGFGAAVGADGLVLVQLFAERAALLREDMPMALPVGSPVPTACQEAAEGSFSGMAIVAMDRQITSADFRAAGSARTPDQRGLYRTYFARTNGDTERTARYTIHPGPILRVE